MSIKDKFLGVVAKFKELSTPKKILTLLITAIVVVGILVVVGVIPKESIFPAAVGGADEFGPVVPSVPVSTNEIVKGYFRGGKCVADVESHTVPAPSLEGCRELGRTMDGIVAVGFRNNNHTTESLKNTCFFYTCISPDYDKNDPVNAADIYHTMSCVNDAANFEDCA